jgi:hypothetical protein
MTDKTSAPAGSVAPRTPLRQHFRTGIEAALKTEPVALAASDARTMLGLVVKGLVFEAAYGRVAAIKVMLSLLDGPAEQTG